MPQLLRSSPVFRSSPLPHTSLASHRLTLATDHTKCIIFEVQRKGVKFTSQGLLESLRVSRNGRQLIGPFCQKMDDGFYMRRCVELARKAIGFTSPNPMVGCVIVKDGEIVGEGFHPKAGQSHAEVFALREAGTLAENATAYVSLEPCNHHGRTPPCTDALIKAKVKQVVVGMMDPNPIVASKGVERLKESGIDVVVGVEQLFCQKLNEAYIHRMLTGNPFVTLRYSMTINGRISSHLGRGAHEPGGYYSKLMQECDGVVISGSSLSITTSALPISSETGANQPLKIIVTGSTNSLHLPVTSIESGSRVLVVSEKEVDVEPRSEKVEAAVLQPLNLKMVLDHCRGRGLCSVVVDLREERGAVAELLGGCLKKGLVQKVVVELRPVWDDEDKEPLPSLGVERRKLKDMHSYVTDESVVVEGYVS